jgi:hypothetical protein
MHSVCCNKGPAAEEQWADVSSQNNGSPFLCSNDFIRVKAGLGIGVDVFPIP